VRVSRRPGPSRLPRARGDRPSLGGVSGFLPAASPRSRGSAPEDHRGQHATRGFPALAGIGPRPPKPSVRSPGLPRARGDRPYQLPVYRGETAASPRSRGSAFDWRETAWVRAGFPALAGIGPGLTLSSRETSWLPRARGDRPWGRFLGIGIAEASPRSRGSARDVQRSRWRAAGFPALAGIGLFGAIIGEACRRLPRARGDRPLGLGQRILRLRASPRSRGSARDRPARVRGSAGFPALAGIGPPRRSARSTRTRLPRARGDRPMKLAELREMIRASPRSRGSARRARVHAQGARGFPALAGIGRIRAGRRARMARLPRARGDRPWIDGRNPGSRWASPRSRGSAPAGGDLGDRDDGFPALAGIGPAPTTRRARSSRLPRARGDRPAVHAHRRARAPASPRSRGSAMIHSAPNRRGTGFPALAGIGPRGTAHAASAARLPRARGDRPTRPLAYSPSRGLPRARGDRPFIVRVRLHVGQASPRSRGSAPGVEVHPVRVPGFPALAGIGPVLLQELPDGGRLPRARGDRPRDAERVSVLRGASPRSRGSARRAAVSPRRARGFPALAGIGLETAATTKQAKGLPRARGDRPRGKPK